MLPNLRVAKVRSEIINVLLKIHANKSPVMIWQKDKETKRFLNSACISEIEENVGVFHLCSTSGSWNSNIKGELALYFKGEEQSILFKAKNLIVQKNELIVPIPSEVRLLEKRNQPRLCFDLLNRNNNILLQKIFENGNRKQFSIRVIDISTTGAAIFLGKADSKYFYVGDSVYFIEMFKIALKNSVPGKVVYIKSVEFSGSGLNAKGYRVGIQFDCYLTSDQLQSFNNQL